MRWKEDLLIVLVAVFVSLSLTGLSSASKVMAETNCDIDCVNDKITALTRRIVALEKIVVGSKSTTTKTTGAGESFKNIGGGSAAGVDWVKVEGSDFTFDQSLYGNVNYVTWQGWMDNGTGSVRLFDSTNGRGVDGSEMSLSANGKASFYSGNLAIWRGQNQYYIQVKSSAGGMVTISGVRLRIVTK